MSTARSTAGCNHRTAILVITLGDISCIYEFFVSLLDIYILPDLIFLFQLVHYVENQAQNEVWAVLGRFAFGFDKSGLRLEDAQHLLEHDKPHVPHRQHW